jgi:hypothetical protein
MVSYHILSNSLFANHPVRRGNVLRDIEIFINHAINKYVEFEILTAVTVNNTTLWDCSSMFRTIVLSSSSGPKSKPRHQAPRHSQ